VSELKHRRPKEERIIVRVSLVSAWVARHLNPALSERAACILLPGETRCAVEASCSGGKAERAQGREGSCSLSLSCRSAPRPNFLKLKRITGHEPAFHKLSWK
jgi:hypothetical protein